MGITRSQIFTSEQNRLSSLFKAMAHPARIAILQHLSRQQGCICNDLVNEIGLAQPTISQHLKELKTMGIIKGEIERVKVCYCIDADTWEQITQELDFFLQEVKPNC